MRELIWDVDYFVRYLQLPYHIGGVSTLNDDGTYNIFINSRLYVDKQWQAFLHELIHCEAGHLDYRKDLPLEIKEWEAEHLKPILKYVS